MSEKRPEFVKTYSGCFGEADACPGCAKQKVVNDRLRTRLDGAAERWKESEERDAAQAATIERLREALEAALCNDAEWWKTARAALDWEGET